MEMGYIRCFLRMFCLRHSMNMGSQTIRIFISLYLMGSWSNSIPSCFTSISSKWCWSSPWVSKWRSRSKSGKTKCFKKEMEFYHQFWPRLRRTKWPPTIWGRNFSHHSALMTSPLLSQATGWSTFLSWLLWPKQFVFGMKHYWMHFCSTDSVFIYLCLRRVVIFWLGFP